MKLMTYPPYDLDKLVFPPKPLTDSDDEEEEDYSSYEEDTGYSRRELDELYRDAFEGDPENEWNID